MRKTPLLTQEADVGLVHERLAADVRRYLTLEPRQLPSRYLYDPLGSALFEAICRLPWYRITRAELGLLEAHGREVFEAAGRLANIVELGPGSGEKLATLIGAARRGAPAAKAQASSPLDLHLVDVSAAALEVARKTLGGLDAVQVIAHEASYETGLRDVMRRIEGGGADERPFRPRSPRTLVLFLGSNIGNFDPPAAQTFLRGVRAALTRDDLLLLGVDLVKPEAELLAAYDDPLGVTAAFNRNLLSRINRELGGNFDLRRFAHRAVWNPAESRIEMHLVSLERQRVRVPAIALSFTLAAGEFIWTESSYKFEPDDIGRRLEAAGFSAVRQWVNEEDRFALTLVKAG